MSQNASIAVGKPGEDEWIPCGTCDRSTYHQVLTVVNSDYESLDDDYQFSGEYMTLMCRGCRTVSFCVRSTNSEDIDFDLSTGEQRFVPSLELYPRRIAGPPLMENVQELPFGILTVYQETTGAIRNDQRILAGIGIRAIVEAVCKDKGATGERLKDQIKELVAMNIVTEDEAKILHSLQFMGNKAAHEVKAHTIEELSIALGVTEHLLQGVYIVPKLAAKLPKKPPKEPRVQGV